MLSFIAHSDRSSKLKHLHFVKVTGHRYFSVIELEILTILMENLMSAEINGEVITIIFLIQNIKWSGFQNMATLYFAIVYTLREEYYKNGYRIFLNIEYKCGIMFCRIHTVILYIIHFCQWSHMVVTYTFIVYIVIKYDKFILYHTSDSYIITMSYNKLHCC